MPTGVCGQDHVQPVPPNVLLVNECCQSSANAPGSPGLAAPEGSLGCSSAWLREGAPSSQTLGCSRSRMPE